MAPPTPAHCFNYHTHSHLQLHPLSDRICIATHARLAVCRSVCMHSDTIHANCARFVHIPREYIMLYGCRLQSVNINSNQFCWQSSETWWAPPSCVSWMFDLFKHFTPTHLAFEMNACFAGRTSGMFAMCECCFGWVFIGSVLVCYDWTPGQGCSYLLVITCACTCEHLQHIYMHRTHKMRYLKVTFALKPCFKVECVC